MGAVFFYHLTQQPLEVTLPMLLGKARAAGWKIAVRGTSAARLDWLDDKLWTGDDGFLPHGREGSGFDADQPILLTTSPEAPNSPDCMISVDGAEVTEQEVASLERTMILFDGNDGDAVAHARTQWKALTQAGCAAQYWSQESGRWEKKAESGASS
ncbi:MAG: DNA polymerase III subunit chi [Paracoccaceae bacterium]